LPSTGPERLEQLRVLAHPLRLRLFELFALAPRTTKQAATALGQPPTRLYHHVAELERVGLVRLRETRPNRGTIEKYFEAATRGLASGVPAVSAAARGSRAGRAALRRGAALARRGLSPAAGTLREHEALGVLLFDQAREEFVRTMGALDAGRDPERLPLLVRITVGSKSGVRARVRRLASAFVLQLLEIERAHKIGPGEETWAITLALLPSTNAAPAAAPPDAVASKRPPARRTRRAGRARRSS
jgi:DNA-binding transcriptional ArsR family regulator